MAVRWCWRGAADSDCGGDGMNNLTLAKWISGMENAERICADIQMGLKRECDAAKNEALRIAIMGGINAIQDARSGILRVIINTLQKDKDDGQ